MKILFLTRPILNGQLKLHDMESLFAVLIVKIIPLYLNIALGFIAAKTLDVHRDTIAKIMFFLINPLIVFNGVLSVHLSASVLSLPLLTFCVSSGLSFLFYWLGGFLWKDSTRNLLAFSSGTGNTGYFGIPLAIILFPDEGESDYILAILGMTLYENTFGYYWMSKGTSDSTHWLVKLVRLPALYAFFSGLILNALGMPIPTIFADFMIHIKGAFTVLGMMVIGLGLASFHQLKFDTVFIGLAFFAKFFIWPALMLLLIAIDKAFLHIYTDNIHGSLLLLSMVPLAVNMAIFASLLKAQPEKASTAIFLSTLLALIYIPLMVTIFIGNV